MTPGALITLPPAISRGSAKLHFHDVAGRQGFVVIAPDIQHRGHPHIRNLDVRVNDEFIRPPGGLGAIDAPRHRARMPLTHCIGRGLVEDDSQSMRCGPGRIRVGRYDGEQERQSCGEKQQQVAPCHPPSEGSA